jgi:CheY-like chemotaxis protein
MANFTIPLARLLVVDDIRTNLRVAEGLLVPYLAVVDTCLGGAEALELVKQHEYDIIFMDHMMPEMDGIEATMKIRSWEKEKPGRRQIPVIALTANAVSGMREMFLEKGFDDFLSKPVDTAKLDEILARWISKEKKELGVRDLRAPIPDPQSLIIPGVDTKRGIAMTGGTLAGYKQVLAIFRQDVKERLAMIDKAPNAETLPVFTSQVHGLKSALSSLGALMLSGEAARLEDAGKTGNMPLIQEELPGFATRLKELMAAIGAALDIKEEKAEAGGITTSDTLSVLRELRAALEAQNTEAIDRILDELNLLNTDPAIRKILETISDQVLMAEYDDALKTINETPEIKL